MAAAPTTVGTPMGDNRYTQALPGQGVAMIAYAGTGMDTGIGDLDGGAQTCYAAGGQSIDGQNQIRFDLTDQSLDNFGGFHTGLGHDAGDDAADAGGVILDGGDFEIARAQMPVDEEVIHTIGPKASGVTSSFPSPTASMVGVSWIFSVLSRTRSCLARQRDISRWQLPLFSVIRRASSVM